MFVAWTLAGVALQLQATKQLRIYRGDDGGQTIATAPTLMGKSNPQWTKTPMAGQGGRPRCQGRDVGVDRSAADRLDRRSGGSGAEFGQEGQAIDLMENSDKALGPYPDGSWASSVQVLEDVGQLRPPMGPSRRKGIRFERKTRLSKRQR